MKDRAGEQGQHHLWLILLNIQLAIKHNRGFSWYSDRLRAESFLGVVPVNPCFYGSPSHATL